MLHVMRIVEGIHKVTSSDSLHNDLSIDGCIIYTYIAAVSCLSRLVTRAKVSFEKGL